MNRPEPDAWALFWRGFVRIWIIALIATATYAIVSDRTAPAMPFPMQWGGPHWTTVVGPQVAGDGHACHPGRGPARPTRVERTPAPCAHSSRPSSSPRSH